MKRLAAILIAAASALVAYGDTHPCPKYQIWGASKCEWIAYCADGQPWRGQPCGERRTPQPQPNSSPEASPPPQPMPPPQPTPPPPPPVQPASPPAHCPDGQQWRGSTCVCPDGYRWSGASCKPISRDCEVHTVFATHRGKKVLLVNGSAFDLFQRYIGDLELLNIEPNYDTLRVYVYDQSNRRQELRATLSMGDLFLGVTYKDKWRRLLRNRPAAADRSLPLEDAKLLDSDVICGQR